MPIGFSSYCKRCEKIALGGAHGKLLRASQGFEGVCTCVRPADLRLVGKNDNETTWSPSSIQPSGFSPGTSTSVGSSWTRPGDKSYASPVIKKSPRMRTESEKNSVIRCSMHGEQETLHNECRECLLEEGYLMRTEQERNNGREIERKYRVMDGVSLNTLHHHLKYGSPTKTLEGTSVDIFWSQPGVDFIRLRENTLELTVKVTDRLTTEDRVEKNLKVESFEKGLQWATTVFGKPKGANRTTFYVYYLPTAEVTIYEVQDYDQVFLEIEAGSIEEVTRIETELKKTITLEQEFKSLYQILFGGK